MFYLVVKRPNLLYRPVSLVQYAAHFFMPKQMLAGWGIMFSLVVSVISASQSLFDMVQLRGKSHYLTVQPKDKCDCLIWYNSGVNVVVWHGIAQK